MEPDQVVIGVTAAILVALTVLPALLRARRLERDTGRAKLEALRYGLHEPASLHPVVDTERCIGIGNCVEACPEHVLGFEGGQALAVAPARCIGHGLCERVCPVDAIRLVFGTESRGVDLPRVKANFETNVPGLFIVGELGGMGLVANAFEQGRQCVDWIAKQPRTSGEGLLDLVIVGCGPAGLSAALSARHRGLDALVLEKETDLGGTVRHYPRKKLVMTRPVKIPGGGKLPLREIRKEELIDVWGELVDQAALEPRMGETVRSVDRVGPLHFRVISDGGIFEARRVILAIGRRGVPRKLGVPGEASPHVAYALREAEAYTSDRILVVGGGDSAVEAALALAAQPGNEVRISYRRETFNRIKPGNHERIREALSAGRIEALWRTSPREIRSAEVVLTGETTGSLAVPADQVFVFIGGELPTPFLRQCGVEVETKFGEP